MPELALNDAGRVGIEMRDGVRLYFQCDTENGRLYCFSPFAEIPANPSSAWLMALMRAQGPGSGTIRGCIAVADWLGSLIYSVCLDGRCIDIEQLRETLLEVLHQRDNLRHIN